MGVIYDKALEYKNKYPDTVGWRLKKHCDVVEKYLNPGEEVSYVFYGQLNNEWYKIFDTCVIVITNKRLLIGQKYLIVGSYYSQITPDLYNDMQVYNGMLFGKIFIDTIKEEIVITDLAKNSLPEIETNISEFMMSHKNKEE